MSPRVERNGARCSSHTPSHTRHKRERDARRARDAGVLEVAWLRDLRLARRARPFAGVCETAPVRPLVARPAPPQWGCIPMELVVCARSKAGRSAVVCRCAWRPAGREGGTSRE